MDFIPTSQQTEAVTKIKEWFKTIPRKQVFYLGGYAGTGKTTLAKIIANEIRGEVLFGAFTGKAALVLQKKGCAGASTLHSLIYIPVVDNKTGVVTFRKNPVSPLNEANLLIVDECSMVGEDIGRDLLSFGTPILVIGDPFQLPPVMGEGFFTRGKPDYMLTEIHRQALENPIIQMSMKIRNGTDLKAGMYGESKVINGAAFDYSEILNTEQLLAGRNITRHSMNAKMRDVLGFDSEYPMVDDRLICQRNDTILGILNGSMWSVDQIKSTLPQSTKLVIKSLDEDTKNLREVHVHEYSFKQSEKELYWKAKKQYQDFCFGYCITTHKAQGSQWKDIIIFDESYCFRDNGPKWLYTAITRAEERVTVVQ